MTTAFVGDMALRFQEMLLQFLLGVLRRRAVSRISRVDSAPRGSR